MSRFTLRLACTLALSGALTAGCGAQPGASDPPAEATAALLEQPNGGMTTADEMPSFNDTNLVAVPELTDAVGADALLDGDGNFTADTAPAAQRHVFRVMVLWGHVPHANDGAAPGAPATPPAVTDWSGSLSVAGGRVSVRRTLGFDAGDSVAARTDPSRVDFVSHTRPFIDGLALTVRAPASTATLHLSTAAFEGDIPLPDADGTVRYLADGRNGVYYAAYEERPACDQGFVFGHWNRVRPQLGMFRGHVMDAVGIPRGSIRGVWGRTRGGAQVFFGKHITNEGRFDGLLGGAYGDGHFAGAWGTRAGARGELHGRYFDGVEHGDGRGPFLGRWREACQ